MLNREFEGQAMLKRLKTSLPLIAIAGVSAMSLGMVAAVVEGVNQAGSHRSTPEASLSNPRAENGSLNTTDPVLSLASQPASQRAEPLMTMAEGRASLNRSRARYLLALDLINADRGGSAIPLLEGLEADYPEMAVYSLMALAQAQAAAGQSEAAAATEQRLLNDFSDDPAIAPLLYTLGQQDPTYWDLLLQTFPDHPAAVEVAHRRLTEDPYRGDALPLLMTMARVGLHHPGAGAALIRLSEEFGEQLSPADWQTVGFGLWRLDDYKNAGPAYAQASPSPRNLYRAARGLQIANQKDQAIALFTQLDQQFPTAPETATGLLRLTRSLSPEKSLGVLDQVVDRFPDRAAEALQLKADILDDLDSPDSAQAMREQVLQDYTDSDAAADLRLNNAFQAAERGDLAMAVSWAQDVVKYSPQRDLAANAGFWVGKWANQLGQAQVAHKSWEQVIGLHPESYYAWRSAVALGWEVGDFRTVRSVQPQVALPQRRNPLPTGSVPLQELYLLGQDKLAWERWQTEFTSRQDPSVEEQFVDGLMRLGTGDNLDGIYQVSSLAWTDDPTDLAKFQEIKQTADYWQAVYPFPYADLIQKWSAQRGLNPLLVTALIRQESRFESQIRSSAGAAGLMQVMPGTADWIKGQAGLSAYDLNDPNSNIELGTWYLDYTHGEYGDHSLFAVASYNAGPGNVAKWIDRGNFKDADDFVEKIPFPETQGYVRAVLGGYWNYLRLYNPEIATRVEQTQQRYHHVRPDAG
jgi:soluble lytic murein transglycosylase